MTGKKQGAFRVGTSGYQYEHWQGDLYPKEAPKKEWFDYYVKHFDTVEINNTFYNLPEAHTFDDWRRRAPEGFCYVLKFSRYGSHIKRLKSPKETIGLFLERADRLKSLLGPILVQLPPRWHADPERLEKFVAAAPSDHRWAFEFRDPGWLCEAIYRILRKQNAALCIHDMLRDHPREVTADWVYLRYHGTGNGGDYTYQALSAQAQQIQDYLSDGLDVFAYFNNDAHGYAVRNALDLRRYVRGE